MGGIFLVRPYAFDFLIEMSRIYEIIIFTASTKDYADIILNLLDPKCEFFMHRLYREHTSLLKLDVIKDLTKLNRDLKKTIIIDNLHTNFKLQPDNGIHIRTWTNDIWDKQLYYISNFLKRIVKEEIDDVRPVIRSLKECNHLEESTEPDYRDMFSVII